MINVTCQEALIEYSAVFNDCGGKHFNALLDYVFKEYIKGRWCQKTSLVQPTYARNMVPIATLFRITLDMDFLAKAFCSQLSCGSGPVGGLYSSQSTDVEGSLGGAPFDLNPASFHAVHLPSQDYMTLCIANLGFEARLVAS